MTSTILSKKLQKILPNKKTYLLFVFFFILLTMGAVVALANENAVIVETDVLNVRYGPGLSHDVLTQVKEKERLFVLEEENKWYKVRLNNDKIGWVASWLVGAADFVEGEKEFVRVNATSVNIRKSSNSEAEIIGLVYKDTELQVLYKDGPWYQILYMGQVAWIHGDYTEKIELPTQEEINTVDDVVNTNSQSIVKMQEIQTNIRNLPSIEGEIIFTADAGESFDYIETVNDWHHIQITEGQTGYVASWISSIEEIAEANETLPQEVSEARQARAVSSLAEATVVIDAGHGGKDPGAISDTTNIYEKEVTLSTALLLRNRLRDAGANVILTRDNDTFIELNQRVEISHAHGADAFISLHYDATDTINSMSGTTTYYSSDSDLELANTINRYLTENGPLPNNGVRLSNYRVLQANKQPAVLLELGYMNNSTDIQYIDTQAYQSSVVEAIYQGLREYYGQ